MIMTHLLLRLVIRTSPRTLLLGHQEQQQQHQQQRKNDTLHICIEMKINQYCHDRLIAAMVKLLKHHGVVVCVVAAIFRKVR